MAQDHTHNGPPATQVLLNPSVFSSLQETQSEKQFDKDHFNRLTPRPDAARQGQEVPES